MHFLPLGLRMNTGQMGRHREIGVCRQPGL